MTSRDMEAWHSDLHRVSAAYPLNLVVLQRKFLDTLFVYPCLYPNRTISLFFFKLYFLFIHVCVFVCVRACTCMRLHVPITHVKGQLAEESVLLFTMWILGNKLRLSVSATSAFTHYKFQDGTSILGPFIPGNVCHHLCNSVVF